jgi:hypothetical protein
VSRSDLLTNKQHWSLIPFSFPDYYSTSHWHIVHRFTHGLYSNVIRIMPITLPNSSRAGYSCTLNHIKKVL